MDNTFLLVFHFSVPHMLMFISHLHFSMYILPNKKWQNKRTSHQHNFNTGSRVLEHDEQANNAPQMLVELNSFHWSYKTMHFQKLHFGGRVYVQRFGGRVCRVYQSITLTLNLLYIPIADMKMVVSSVVKFCTA
jgi:hypothetical protein